MRTFRDLFRIGARTACALVSVATSAFTASLLAASFLPAIARAQPSGIGVARAGATGTLPDAVTQALNSAGLPSNSYGIIVRALRPGGLNVAINESLAFNPASTMKLLTAHAALQLLGPAYVWHTEVLTGGRLQDDALDGDLVFRGSGDPRLRTEDLWLLVQRLRAAGLRQINGDVVLDRSAFAPVVHDEAEFDGERWRPYNAGPDALLVNLKTVSFTFVPETPHGPVRVLPSPVLAGVTVPETVPALDGPCVDWRGRLQADFTEPRLPVFRGGFAASCGERTLHVSLLSHTDYFAGLFKALWEQSGGRLQGVVRAGTAPADARRLAQHESRPLAEVLRDMNKNSSNVMARQIYLTIGREVAQEPAEGTRAAQAVRMWLQQRGMPMPDLVLDNGAGLSRVERISAGSLARLLVDAYASPTMPEFIASLPMAGIDGTMRSRTAAYGHAHIKTGLLNEVRALAGYVLSESGRRYVVVFLINHAHSGAGQPAQDALLEWVRRQG